VLLRASVFFLPSFFLLCPNSMSYTQARLDMTDNELTPAIMGAAMDVHRALGPGLLEAVYEECLARELEARGIAFERQRALPVVYKDLKLEAGYRADFIVAGRVVVEIKAIEALAPIHEAIVLTYLRMSGCRFGLLINFHVALLKNGIRRYVNGYEDPSGKTQRHREAQRAERK
jgi:GxxExxY protein